MLAARWRSGSGLKFVDLALANGGRFATMMIAAHFLVLGDFGRYSAAIVVVLTAAALANVGLPTAATRFIAAAVRQGASPQRLLSGLLKARLLTIAGVMALVWGLAETLNLPREGNLVAVVQVVLGAQILSVFLEFAIAGLDRQRAYVIVVSSGREVARIAGVLWFLSSPSVLRALLMEAIPLATACALSLYVVLHDRARWPESATNDGGFSNRALRFAAAVTPVSLLGVGVDWLPPMLVVLLGTHLEVAQFATAWRWIGLLPTMLPFAGVALVSAYSRLDPAARLTFIRETFRLAVALPLLATAVLGGSGVLLVPLLFGSEFAVAGRLSLLVAAAAPVRVIGPLYRQVLSLDDATTAAASAPLVGSAVTLAAALVLRVAMQTPIAVTLAFTLGGIVEVGLLVTFLRRSGHEVQRSAVAIAMATMLGLAAVGLVLEASSLSTFHSRE